MATTYEQAVKNANEAASIGDTDLEIAWLQKAKGLKQPSIDLSPPKLFDAMGREATRQFKSLANFPDPYALPNTPIPDEKWRDYINTAAAMSIPASMVNTAAKRLILGAGTGASHGVTMEEKAKGGLQGLALAGMFETLPAVQGVLQAGKRALYDPTWNPENVVGQTLKRMASDPENPQVLGSTIKALENPQTLVRGSDPTTPQASRNGGLWALYKAVMAREPAADRAITDAQNLARNKGFKELGVGENAGAAGTALKQSAVADLNKAESVLRDTPIDLKGVLDEVDFLLESGAAKTPQIRTQLKSIRENLFNSPTDGQLESALEQVQGIRTAIGRAIYNENGLKIAGPIGSQLSGISGQITNKLDDAIEEALWSTGNKGLHQDFKEKYALGSKLEQRASTLKDLMTKGSSPGELPVIGRLDDGTYGPTGEYQDGDILSVKLSNVLRGKDKTAANARRLLTPAQLERIDAINSDIRRAIPKDVKRGSDTFQNMATDYILSDILGPTGGANSFFGGLTKGVTNAVSKAIPSFVSKAVPSANPLENEDLRKVLVKAMRDPKFSARIMKNAVTSPLIATDIPARVGPSLIDYLNDNKR